jgi:glycine oxidase
MSTIKAMPPRPPDIIVVGAGIVGCAVAFELARRGASVQMVDERAAGMGATHAAAGILAPHIEVSADTAFLQLAVRSLNLYDDFITRAQTDSGLSVPYRRTGTLQVATSDEGMRGLRNAAARLETQHVAVGLLDGKTARAEEPHLSEDVIGGLVVPMHGFVAPGPLIRALAAAARRHGAQVIEGSRVRRIVCANADVTVETDRGPLAGSAVVLAAGSWSGQIEIAGLPDRAPVRPIRGQLVRLAWKGPTVRRVIWSERCYLVPWDDGTMLVGATVEDAGFDERTTAAGVRDLLDAACDIVPGAWTAGFIDARAGLRPASADLLPIVGASRALPNLMYATAHYRNGILLAPVTAELVADAMLNNRVDPAMAVLTPQRFGNL